MTQRRSLKEWFKKYFFEGQLALLVAYPAIHL
jgi:hypothetical protein